jgi:hypothetical protein
MFKLVVYLRVQAVRSIYKGKQATLVQKSRLSQVQAYLRYKTEGHL